MACIGKYTSLKTGKVSWRLRFQRVISKKREVFSSSFNTKEEAEKFCELWEYIFFVKGAKAIKINRLEERWRRKFPNTIRNKKARKDFLAIK